jgi:ADP-heptose:LPS heptosyltransferase
MSDILIAPFSNSAIRDWPIGHYARLVALLLEGDTNASGIRIIGTRNQRQRAFEIVRSFDATKVINECGRMTWTDVSAALRRAACVIGNNSGVAHLAGFYGVPTVCVFGGSHQRLEWRPLGFNVTVLTRVIGCSPCQLDHGQVSPYGKACLREIEPETVAAAAFSTMKKVRALREQGAHLDRSQSVARGATMRDGMAA